MSVRNDWILNTFRDNSVNEVVLPWTLHQSLKAPKASSSLLPTLRQPAAPKKPNLTNIKIVEETKLFPHPAMAYVCAASG